jgi:group I intron endonuclease
MKTPSNPETIVYQIENRLNGHAYIGVTCRPLKRRLIEHRGGRRDCAPTAIFLALRKYGRENFIVTEVARFPTWAEAAAEEVRLIAELRPEYNQTDGGDGGVKYWRGRKRSPETCEKMRQARLAKPIRYWLGRKRSPETIERCRAAAIGKPQGRTTEREAQNAVANMRRASEARKRPIFCENDGVLYTHAGAAAERYGLRYRDIHSATSRGGTVQGLKFRYEVRDGGA